MTDRHLLLIDASGFAFRAYYAWSPSYREDGLPTWAILGFMAMIYKVRGRAQNDAPSHAIAVFDAPGQNFRHKLFPEYKAHRDIARRLELDRQFPYMRHAAETIGFHPMEVNGFEADDVIATLALLFVKSGGRVTIVSSDKDFGQLAVDGKIEIVDPMQRKRVLEADVIARWGVEPALVPQVQALAGDSVDNIPGIEGCGPETAANLIRSAGNLDGLFRGIEDIRSARVRIELKRKRSLYTDHQGKAFLSAPIPGQTQMIGFDWVKLFLKLTTLRRNIPMKIDFDDLKIMDVMESHIRAILKSLGASQKFEALFTNENKVFRYVDHVDDPWEWWRESLLIPTGRGKLPEIPQCGFYMKKLAKAAPWVGARIWRVPEIDLETGQPTGRDILRCEVGGQARDPEREWPTLSMYPIKAADFDYEMADLDHAKRYRPDDPKSTPDQPVDFAKMKAPHCPPSPAKPPQEKTNVARASRSKTRT